jgi:hypothetical protein
MEAKNHNITWLQSPNQTEIMPRYQLLDIRERGKRRLRWQAVLNYRKTLSRSEASLSDEVMAPVLRSAGYEPG